MLHRSLLGELVDEGRCLDSPGVVSKADMIGDLLATFGTRSAVMVGDRAGDRDAAWENGIPHVHCAFGFAAREEEVRAEGVIEDLPELLELLAARRAGVEAALAAGGVLRASVAPPFVLGVGGPPAAGKSLFARDAARVLADHGFQVALVPLAEIFGRGAREGAGGVGQGAGRAERLAPSEQGDPLAALDLAALSERLLEPYAAGREVVLVTPAGELRVAPDDLLLLEGPRLLDPRLRARLDRVIWLETEDATILRRVAGRDARLVGPGPLAELRATLLPADREHASRYRPALLADAVLAADDPLRPRPLDAAELAAPAPALEQRG